MTEEEKKLLKVFLTRAYRKTWVTYGAGEEAVADEVINQLVKAGYSLQKQ